MFDYSCILQQIRKHNLNKITAVNWSTALFIWFINVNAFLSLYPELNNCTLQGIRKQNILLLLKQRNRGSLMLFNKFATKFLRRETEEYIKNKALNFLFLLATIWMMEPELHWKYAAVYIYTLNSAILLVTNYVFQPIGK